MSQRALGRNGHRRRKYHSLALRSDGTVIGWGFNIYGQASPPMVRSPRSPAVMLIVSVLHQAETLFRGEVIQFSPGPAPSMLTDVIAISAGQYHNLALKSYGTVVAWGTLILDDFGMDIVPAYVRWA